MKKGRRKWAALSALVLLLVLSLGAVQTLPLEEEERDSLTVFQGNRVLCDTGCQGYYMQQGKPVRARGIDRQEDRPALYCSYPLVCVNCQRHTGIVKKTAHPTCPVMPPVLVLTATVSA